MIEQVLFRPIAGDPSPVFLDFFQSLATDLAEADIDGTVEVSNVMALDSLPDAGVARVEFAGAGQDASIAVTIPDIVGEIALHDLADRLVFPHITGFGQNVALLIRHGDGAAGLPCFLKGCLIDDPADPGYAAVYIQAHSPLIRAGSTDEDVIVEHMNLTCFRPFQQGA